MQVSIEGDAIHDIASFYEEINRVFMSNEDWTLGNSLDAFDDLLYGGYGLAKDATELQLVWRNFEHSRQALGYAATRAYYQQKLEPGSPFSKDLFENKLRELERGNGQTYFDILLAIIADHPQITLVPA